MTEPDVKEPPEDLPVPAWWRQPVLVAVLVLCFLPELVLSGADWGLWGSPRWRIQAIRYGGFWSGLLHGWQPNYPGQGWAMFATYAFLHGGALHFGANMMTLLSLGPALGQRFGQMRLLAIYVISVLGGALGFAALAATTQPMVGASGALFGLAGALVGLAWWRARQEAGSLRPVVQAILLLAVLNLVMWWVMDGQLAWETHLGGFVAGGLAGLLLDRRQDPGRG